MKIKPKARAKYEWFLGLGVKEPRRLVRIAGDTRGVGGMEAFHVFESTGKLVATREPEVLEALFTGKELHGVTVEVAAEDFVGRILFSREIKLDYPRWVTEEIFAQARKIAQATLGFVPAFVRTGRDFSELGDGEVPGWPSPTIPGRNPTKFFSEATEIAALK